ncbi:MAG: NIPSNAP family protein, partial [Rhodospirillaceae bacterium]|nr:NIPSNAP family protein [Rhodospirillaceae bacterium]
MIFELRVYTVRPGTVNQVLEASGTVAREIREGD